jgi:uncharacterized protein
MYRPILKKVFILFLFFCASTLLATNKWPAPQGYVNDFANVVPADQSQTLEAFLTEVEQKTGAEISVVTTPSVEGGDIDGAAVDLFKTWGIGKKGKDDGILILASIQDHRVRIEVGYGLEAVVTDGQAGSIIRQYMTPYFKESDYGQGLTQGAAAVAQLVAASEGVTLDGQVAQPVSDENGGYGTLIEIIIFVVFFILISIFNNRRGFWGGGGFYGGGWGGGGFGGGGGGGFGGFGGGGSGGGGASGGW